MFRPDGRFVHGGRQGYHDETTGEIVKFKGAMSPAIDAGSNDPGDNDPHSAGTANHREVALTLFAG